MAKPNTSTAMRKLLGDIRSAIPFDTSEEELCAHGCKGCSVKLLEFLSQELESWDYRLDQGEVPSFGDISQMAKNSQKIYKVLKRNGLVE